MRLLILGAGGSVGRHLVPQALGAGYEVTVLIRDLSKFQVHDDRLRVIVGDALDPAAVDGAVRGQDAVIFSLGRSRHGNLQRCFPMRHES